ncbi:DUF4124 domain-containing protein [Endozoicomonas sp.]|nr:DUF4124 domain-containing protein [Endozoicomonas sp.]
MKKIIMLLLLAPGILGADKVYKWLDGEGTVHYSSSPPVNTRPGDVARDAGELIIFEPEAIAPAVVEKQAAQDNSQLMAYCHKLRNNLLTLYKNKRVRVRQADGQFVELDEAAKEEKATEVSSLLKQRCHSGT